MIQTVFGRRSGLRVSEYALGTAPFGRDGTSSDEHRAIFERFVEAGGTFLDTADSYNDGASEFAVATLLGHRRDDFVLASKFSRRNGAQEPVNRVGNSRRAMVQAVEQSLRRLETDRIDLYWAHFDDRVTPMEEIALAFDDLVGAGKILYGGLSNFAAWRVALGFTYADQHGLSPIIGVQVEHSLLERGAETELLPAVEALGLGAALYSPLGGGLLTLKHREGRDMRPTVIHQEDTPAKTRALDALRDVAHEVGAPPSTVAIAWQREFDARSTTDIVTIIGPRRLEQLEGYLDALELQLSDEHLRRLDEASAIYRGAPHDGIGGPPDLGDRARIRTRSHGWADVSREGARND